MGPVFNLTREEVTAFVGNKHLYYFGAWRRSRSDGPYAGFNWAAAIFSLTWMLYRKMYREALVAFGVLILLGAGLGFVGALMGGGDDTRILDSLTKVVFAAASGVLGNALYRRRARLAIARARAEEPDEAARLALLARRGGTSGLAILGGIAFTMALSALGAVLAKR